MTTKPIMIKAYDYVEFSIEKNKDNKVVLAIYGISDKTLNKLFPGVVVKWNNKRQDELNGYTDNPLIWTGEVYACFTDCVVIYLY